MTKSMKRVMSFAVAGIIAAGMMVPTFADTPQRPADIYAEANGISVEEAYELRHATDQTFGELSEEAGTYDAFSTAMQAFNKDRIADLLEDGTITQDQADAMYAQMEACDGTPGAKDGLKLELHDGSGYGMGQGTGLRDGSGFNARGAGGNGLRDGSGSGAQNGNGFNK